MYVCYLYTNILTFFYLRHQVEGELSHCSENATALHAKDYPFLIKCKADQEEEGRRGRGRGRVGVELQLVQVHYSQSQNRSWSLGVRVRARAREGSIHPVAIPIVLSAVV